MSIDPARNFTCIITYVSISKELSESKGKFMKIKKISSALAALTCIYIFIYFLATILLSVFKLRFRVWFTDLSVKIIVIGLFICIVLAILQITKSVLKYFILLGFIACGLIMINLLFVSHILFSKTESAETRDNVKYSVVMHEIPTICKDYYEYKNCLISGNTVRIHESYTVENTLSRTIIYDKNGNITEEISADSQ